ncbi:MAG: hypothetical protein U5N85_13145 [Arcicella sp.]|nr:hypothetical protein [Arcicella sp.]
MKNPISIIAILVFFFTSLSPTFAQDKGEKMVTFKFKNNSLLPHKYTFITYAPNTKGNGTFGDVLIPNGTKEFKVLVGTKIYLANRKEVNIVMSGNQLAGEPFYVVKLEDDGKVINLRK